VALVLTCCLATAGGACATANADPALGQVEEWQVPTVARWRQFELGVGQEGYVWFLQGAFYDEAQGSAEGISRSGPTLTLSTNYFENALGWDITRGPDGNMWITEPHWSYETEEPDTIGRLEVDGGTVHRTQFEIEGTELNHEYNGPLAIVSGPDNHLWFTDQRLDTQHEVFVGEMDTGGHLVAKHPIHAGVGMHHAIAPEPYGLAVGAEGKVWFTDDGTNEEGRNLVGRINSSGEAEEFPIPTIGAEPGAIALGADGAMWFTEPGKDKIGRVTGAGEIKEFVVPNVTSALKGLVLAPEGNLWFAERQPRPGFGSISPSGEVRSYRPGFEPLDSGALGESVGPEALVLGPDANIWFTDPRPRDEFDPDPTTDEGRFAIPLSPQNTQPPVLLGSPTVGAALSASAGSWLNAPTAESYQWQRCSSTTVSCQDIPGETAPSYLLSSADSGSRIRAVVTASNEAGSSAAASELTAAVQTQPVPRLEVQHYHLEVVGATIASLLTRTRHGVVIRTLALRNVKTGSTVTVTCRGVGCAIARAGRHGKKPAACKGGTCKWVEHIVRGPVVGLTSLTRPMRLRKGARLTVVVTLRGWIGRAFEYRVGSSGVPTPMLTCRVPGSTEKTSAC
jgi:virginiamycin B lyase